MRRSAGRFTSTLGAVRPSPAVIAVYALASLVGGFISVASVPGAGWSKFALVVVVTVVVVALLVVVNFLPWDTLAGKPVISSSIFIAIAALVGAVRGVSFVALAELLGIELPPDYATQIANSIISAIVWLTLAGLVIGSRDRYRGRYRALLLHGDSDVDWDTHPSVEQIKRNLGEMLISTDGHTDVDPGDVAEAIRREIDTNIRPLSHRLWFGAEDEEPRSRLLPLLRDAVAAWTVPVRVVVIVWLVTGILGGARWLGFEQGLVAAGVSALLLAITLVLIRRWIPASAWWRGSALVMGSVVVITATDGILRSLGYSSRLYLDFGSLFLLPVTVTALVLVSAAISLVESDRRTILEIAKRESHEIANKRRQSTFLHNSLQSELTGMAMQLDEAARTGSVDEGKAALERVHALLARSISEDFATFQENPRERIQRIIGGWRGICDVTIDLDHLVLDDPRLGVAAQAMEEIIANAVRHGGASWIRIRARVDPHGLTIEGESSGRIPVDRLSGGDGLGLRVLAEMAPEGISWEATDAGSRMEFVIP